MILIQFHYQSTDIMVEKISGSLILVSSTPVSGSAKKLHALVQWGKKTKKTNNTNE